jgi:NADH dehydrogenase
MSNLVTIFGGSGFLGRYIASRMARQGWRVRVAVRRPNEALFVRTYGGVGQVEPVLANIRDEESTRKAIKGAKVVINCVGILLEDRRQKFQSVQVQGAERIARLSSIEGVERLVHISAIGANTNSESISARTKGEGESSVLKAFPTAVILRPSIVFGVEDGFFNRFAAMSRISPVLPLIGADTSFQPVYVDDVALAALSAALGEVPNGIYELGGPDIETFRKLIERMLKVVRRKKLIINQPMIAAKILSYNLDMLQIISFNIFKNFIVTRDQVKQLALDNIVTNNVGTFVDFEITPQSMDAILESYLYSYRPYGQYTSIHESAGDN